MTVFDALPPEPQTVDNLLAEIEASPVMELTPQADLLGAIEELLDNALHSDECYVSPDDTICFCLIAAVRAALPKCEAIKAPTTLEFQPIGNGHIAKVWRCVRTAHPASPDRHVFGAV